AIVAARATNNDNASVGLDPGLFTHGNAPARLDLPCGSYYLSSIASSGPLTIVAHGNTALYIGGSVTPSNDLTITLDPTAQFDLFIGGTISASAALRIGSPAYPPALRPYAGRPPTPPPSANPAPAGNPPHP